MTEDQHISPKTHCIINSKLTIPLSEIEYSFSRSGGKGGQNVNKVETKVELRYDILHSPSLDEPTREKLLNRLSTRLLQNGVLRLSSETYRSQLKNREDVTERFATLLRDALKTQKKRKPTSPTKSSVEERMQTKKQRSQRKSERSRRSFDNHD